MNQHHPSPEDFALYFRGLLDEAPAGALEEHASVCDDCAERLRAEARVELALYDVLEMPPAEGHGQARTTARRPRRAIAALGFVAAAAAIAAVVLLRLHPARSPGPDPARVETSADERTPPMNARSTVFTTLMNLVVAPCMACSSQVGDTTAEREAAAVAAAPVSLDALPGGWIRAGSVPDSYAMGVDPATLHEGHATTAIVAKPNVVFRKDDFATVMTATDAAPYRGKRVRLAGFVKPAGVTGWAGLWMRVDGARGNTTPLAFDNMGSRPIRGTSDFKRYEVVLDVDPAATKIAYGTLLAEGGRVWIDAPSLEVVSTSVATTGFAEVQAAHVVGSRPMWFVAGSAPSKYTASADTAVHHGDATSLSLASREPVVGDEFGTAMQTTSAEAYRGARVRLTAYVKAENVRGWAGLWMRVDDAGVGTKPLAFDNMEDRPIKGTSDWTPYSIVLDVPPQAKGLALGVLLQGEGHVWMDDVVIESVSGPADGGR
jgi:hypothetical protein